MNRTRWMLVLVGPLPILAGSMILTSLARTDEFQSEHFRNQVVLAQADVSGKNTKAPPRTTVRNVGNRNADALATACHETAVQLVEQLGDDCVVIERPPFVVGGNMSRAELEEWHARTIAPAAASMGTSYFVVKPDKPIRVLLFTDERNYNHFCKELYGDEGVSVYGYYKPGQRTLVMNIGTGGGTLVHELTHALADFDFPAIPDWFNEGLASLHEQCRFRTTDNRPWIEGLENWRLPGLQEAIQKKKLRPLRSLIADNDFRKSSVGINYAQARYFCLYMQRQGVLADYYKRIRANQKVDALGLKAVSEVFPDKSWDELDAEFNAWALTLTR